MRANRGLTHLLQARFTAVGHPLRLHSQGSSMRDNPGHYGIWCVTLARKEFR